MSPRGDLNVGLPFLALCLAAFARHHSLPWQRGGRLLPPSAAAYHHPQGGQPQQLLQHAPPPAVPDSTVREGDSYHMPLAALRHGLSDALAWNEVN